MIDPTPQPNGSRLPDFQGFDGIDPPVDTPPTAGDYGLQTDRLDPTAQSLGAAYQQSQRAIDNQDAPNSGGTGGVAWNGRDGR